MDYLVQPFEVIGNRLQRQEPLRARDSCHAKFLARSLNCAGAVAYENGNVLLVVGEVPGLTAPSDPPRGICHGFRHDLDGCVLQDRIDTRPAWEAPELFRLKLVT